MAGAGPILGVSGKEIDVTGERTQANNYDRVVVRQVEEQHDR